MTYESWLAGQVERHDERMAELGAEDEMRECDVCGHMTPRDLLDYGLCEGCAA